MSGLSLKRTQVAQGAGAELLAICQSATSDGRLNKEEITALTKWLRANRGSGEIPAIDYLSGVVERVVADQVVTAQEREELYDAIKRILPPEIRRAATAARRAVKQLRKEADRSAKLQKAQREKVARMVAKERDRSLANLDFMVAGHFADDRPKTIEKYCEMDDEIILLREPANRYSKYAIQIRVLEGLTIGYVPDDLARSINQIVDSGCLYLAYVKLVLEGGRNPLPVIVAKIYGRDCQRPGLRSLERL